MSYVRIAARRDEGPFRRADAAYGTDVKVLLVLDDGTAHVIPGVTALSVSVPSPGSPVAVTLTIHGADLDVTCPIGDETAAAIGAIGILGAGPREAK